MHATLTHACSPPQEANKAFWSSKGHSASSKLSKILKSPIALRFLIDRRKGGWEHELKPIDGHDGYERERERARKGMIQSGGSPHVFRALCFSQSGGALEGFWNFRTQSGSFK